MENEDENPRGPFSHPYSSSHGFATSSWDLRKNLTETFNKHVGVSSKPNKLKGTKRDASTFVNNKVAQDERNAGWSTSTNMEATKPTATGKPPKQPAYLRAGETKAASGEKRSVSVFLRVRPPKAGMINTVEILPGDPPTKIRTHAPITSNTAKMNRESRGGLQPDSHMVVREFDFQEVFGPHKDNEGVYSTVVAPMVNRMFPADMSQRSNKPESGLLFAYGATNAGKTYSILGKGGHGASGNEKHRGIVSRAIQHVLENIGKFQNKEPGQAFDLHMSVLEIHNENIYDLLDQEQDSRQPGYMREPLKLRETQKHTFIRGLVKRQVNDVKEGLHFAKMAHSKRHTASNNLNSDSSRSHCIFQLQITKRNANLPKLTEGTSVPSGYTTDEEACQITKQRPTTLWIVDLAGSERSKRTNVGTLRQKEASLINKSLMNLMRCLSIIRENQSAHSSSQVIPFRESKLTHFFMPALTGRSSSSISMIVNVNPEAPDYDETNHVLSYASEAKMVHIEDIKIPLDNSRVGAGEYGYNGRPVKKVSAVSQVTKLLKKLSPKKLMKYGHSKDEKKRLTGDQEERKRKVEPILARVPSFGAAPTNSQGSKDVPHAKKMRAANPSSPGGAQRVAATDEHEVLSSKMILTDEEMSQIEARIRLEVAAEMEEQLDQTKKYYTDIIDRMKSQSRESIGVFERSAREAKATEHIDLLLFKLEESEEEMQRQADNHREEISALHQHHQETNAAQQREIEMLRERLSRTNEEEKADVEERQRREQELERLRDELEALRKSKTDLIEAYEHLLADKEEEEPSSEGDALDVAEDEEDSDESINENSPVPAQQSRYMTRNRFAQKQGPKIQRAPLASIPANAAFPSFP
jgi:Kinesin motor domain